MKKDKILYFFVVCLFFTSCSSVKISTVKNQEKRIFNTEAIVVYCNSADIEFRTILESTAKEYFEKNGKSSIQSINLFPPIREYSLTEVYEIIEQNNFDSILFISQIASEKETGFVQVYGVLVPVSSLNTSFDVQLVDLSDKQIILHSTVKSEGESLSSMAKSISKKIVSEILTEECKEFIPIIQELFDQDLTLQPKSEKKYSIIGTSKIGDLTISNNRLEIKLPLSFGVVNDTRGMLEKVDSDSSSYLRISTNNVNELEYIVNLLKKYNTFKE